MNREFYKLKSTVIKALSNPLRLMIIDYLRDGERTVSQIIEAVQEEQSNVSKNLGILKMNGLIKDRKEGLNVYYSLNVCCLDKFLTSLDSVIRENIKRTQELVERNIND